MRPVVVSLAAVGNSPWVPVNELQIAFAIGLSVVLSSGAVLTYTVQHTFDDPGQDPRIVAIARAGTVATVTDTGPDGNGHGLSVGDSLVVTSSGTSNLDTTTANVASVVDANNFTYTVANTGPAAGSVNTKLQSFRVFPHATLTGLSARADGNYAFPIQASRLLLSAYTSGRAYLTLLQGMGR